MPLPETTKREFNELFAEYSPNLKNTTNRVIKNSSNLLTFIKDFAGEFGYNYLQSKGGAILSVDNCGPKEKAMAILVPVDSGEGLLRINKIIPVIVSCASIEYLHHINKKSDKNIKYIFHDQSVADTGKLMIEESMLENINELFSFDCNFMIAPDCIAINHKIVVPASEQFRMKITKAKTESGKNNGQADLVLVAAHTVITLSQVSTRKLDPLKPSKISLKSIHSSDIVKGSPGSILIDGVFYFGDDTVERQKQATVEQTMQAISNAYNVECEYIKLKEFPWIKNHPECIKKIREAGNTVLGIEKVHQFDYMNNDLIYLAEYFGRFDSAIFHFGGVTVTGDETPMFDNQIDTIVQTGVKTLSHLISA